MSVWSALTRGNSWGNKVARAFLGGMSLVALCATKEND